MNNPDIERDAWNRCRFVLEDPGGYDESCAQRANHPGRPLAFWIRTTVVSPQSRPAGAVGELWAVPLTGEAGRMAAAMESLKEVNP